MHQQGAGLASNRRHGWKKRVGLRRFWICHQENLSSAKARLSMNTGDTALGYGATLELASASHRPRPKLLQWRPTKGHYETLLPAKPLPGRRRPLLPAGGSSLCPWMPLSSPKGKVLLFLLSTIFGDVHDFVLEDEQVWRAFARQPHHVLIVILDPSTHQLAIHQLDVDQFLFLTQSFEEAGFFEGLFWGRGPAALGGIGISLRAERHANIVHGDDWGQV